MGSFTWWRKQLFPSLWEQELLQSSHPHSSFLAFLKSPLPPLPIQLIIPCCSYCSSSLFCHGILLNDQPSPSFVQVKRPHFLRTVYKPALLGKFGVGEVPQPPPSQEWLRCSDTVPKTIPGARRVQPNPNALSLFQVCLLVPETSGLCSGIFQWHQPQSKMLLGFLPTSSCVQPPFQALHIRCVSSGSSQGPGCALAPGIGGKKETLAAMLEQ